MPGQAWCQVSAKEGRTWEAGRRELIPHIGNHSLRAASITDYLKSAGTLENAQQMKPSSPRTTNLYDRRNDETSLDEHEKVGI